MVQKEIFQIAGKKKWEFFVYICEVLSRAASTALLTDILVIFMLCLETQKMRCRRTNAMDREGDDLVTRLTKLLAILLVLILSFHQVIAAEAAGPFSKDALSIPSLDENTAIYAGTWVADSEEQAFLLLGNEKVMWLAVATQMEDGTYQLIAQSKPVLSYETYCSGSVEMMDKWDDGRPYFWYSIGHYITICSLRMQVMVHGSFTVDILMLMVDILMFAKKTFISIFTYPTGRIICLFMKLFFPKSNGLLATI